MPTYQTLSEFLREPFGRSDDMKKLSDYNKMYTLEDKKIILNAHTVINNDYYFHVKIPSESQKSSNMYYDVVIRFFTDRQDSLHSSHIRDYYIQFFSNSPGFIYKYAYVYKMNGFLINGLYNKLDPLYSNKPPESTNSKMEISYDKSIYFACRFLNERKFRVLNKFSIPLGKSLKPDRFFKEIKDFQSVKIETEFLNLEKKSLNDLSKNMNAKNASNRDNKKRELDTHRKNAQKSTSGSTKTNRVIKKTASKSTSKAISSIIKKGARKTTRKQ